MMADATMHCGCKWVPRSKQVQVLCASAHGESADGKRAQAMSLLAEHRVERDACRTCPCGGPTLWPADGRGRGRTASTSESLR